MLTIDDVRIKYFTSPISGKIVISKAKLYRACRNEKIPAIKIDGSWYFSEIALDKWVKCDEFFKGKVDSKLRPILQPIPE